MQRYTLQKKNFCTYNIILIVGAQLSKTVTSLNAIDTLFLTRLLKACIAYKIRNNLLVLKFVC